MSIEKLSTKEILDQNIARTVPDGMKQLMVMLHNVRSMHNVGAALRSADAFGIKEIIFSGFTPVPPRPEITKTAIGAEKFVDWQAVESVNDKLIALKEEGYLVIGLEQTDRSELLPDFAPPPDKKVCLVFGNEVTGLDDEILPLIDEFVEIPQYGHKHSLNVSVTVGVTLYAFLVKFWAE